MVSVWFQNRRRPSNAVKLRGITATDGTEDAAGSAQGEGKGQHQRTRQPLKDTDVDIINVSPRTSAADLWKRLPSSSPVRRNTAPPFPRRGPAPRKGSLEWACSKISRAKSRLVKSYNKTKLKGTKEPTTKTHNPKSSVGNETIVPQRVWDAYGKDAVEVALVLVQMRYGEV